MKFFYKLINIINNYSKYIELNITAYLTSFIAILLIIFLLTIGPGSFLIAPFFVIAIPICYIVSFILIIFYNLNRIFFNKKMNFSCLNSRFFLFFWWLNIVINIIFHITVLCLLINIYKQI